MTTPKTATGYTEAEGYAAFLRQQAEWVDESREGKGNVYDRISMDDIDTDEMRAAADFIDRLSRCDVQNGDDLHTLVEQLRGENDRLRDKIARAQSPVGWPSDHLPSVPKEPACTCGGDMAHDYHQDWCPALPAAERS